MSVGATTLEFSEIEGLTLGQGNDQLSFGTSSGVGLLVDGEAGNDTLLGSSHDDLFVGGSGDDRLVGNAGADTLIGGLGDDSISGGDGADFLKTGQGQDTLDGGAGDDTLMNAAGDDSLVGGAGDDLIVATQGQDTLEGGDGSDTLMGGTDGDSIDGGAGNDLILGDLAGVAFNATGTDGVGLASNITGFPSTQLTYELTFASADTVGDTSLGSYAVAGEDNEFSLQLQAGSLAIYVGGAFTNTGIPAASFLDGTITTLAVSWDSATGALEVYLNGTTAYSGTTATGTTLQTGGTFAAGQDQDTLGGGFDTPQAFEGTIYGVRLYDDIRTPGEILDSTHGPVANTSDANLVANWVADPNGASFTDQTGSYAMAMSGDVTPTWSAGADTIQGGTGADTLYGGGGDDCIQGGAGDDSVEGGEGSDTITLHDGFGNDTIAGGEDGDGTDTDVLDLSGMTGPVTVTYTGGEAGTITDGTDTLTFSEIEQIITTDQADVVDASAAAGPAGINVDTRDGADTITGTDNGDTVDAGAGDDDVFLKAGDDVATGGAGNDSIEGADGQDSIEGGAGNDTLRGGSGQDTLQGGDDNDSLGGWTGDDSLDGGSGSDTLKGGTGDDRLTGGGDNDTFVYSTGDGADTITDFNAGNTGALRDGDTTNNDFIDLSAFYTNLDELRADFDDDGVLNQSSGDYSDNTAMAGGDSLTFQGASRSSFSADNTGVVCFTKGTLIATAVGPVPIETLSKGDRVLTRDNGFQEILWIGQRHLDQGHLAAAPHLRPIVVSPRLLRTDQPLVVSPQHGVLLRQAGDEVFVRAKHLAQTAGGQARVARGVTSVTYVHIMFERHEVILANGAFAESFFPGPVALRTLSRDDLAEMATLFPEHLATLDHGGTWTPARDILRMRDLPEHLSALAVA